ncbi:hypothetical protein [Nostoc sp. MG11]|nr:hypothetical protein [Nostoc sp. MG11]
MHSFRKDAIFINTSSDRTGNLELWHGDDIKKYVCHTERNVS